jgi:hypothetical protein
MSGCAEEVVLNALLVTTVLYCMHDGVRKSLSLYESKKRERKKKAARMTSEVVRIVPSWHFVTRVVMASDLTHIHILAAAAAAGSDSSGVGN